MSITSKEITKIFSKSGESNLMGQSSANRNSKHFVVSSLLHHSLHDTVEPLLDMAYKGEHLVHSF